MMRNQLAHLALAGAFALMLPQSALTRNFSIPFSPVNFSHPLTIDKWVARKYHCPNLGVVAEEDLSHGRVRTEMIDPSALAFQFRTVS